MTSRTILTESGPLKVNPPTDDLLCKLAQWPKGIMAFTDQPLWGIVMEDHEGELMGIRNVYGHYKKERDTDDLVSMHRLLLPLVLGNYLKLDFRGILLPCAYRQSKPGLPVVVGYAVFGKCLSLTDPRYKLDPNPLYESHKEMIVDDDPTWNYVVKAGIHEMVHLPSVPITVRLI